MMAIVKQYMDAHRKQIVVAFENWWNKYWVTLSEIEGRRNSAISTVQDFMKVLKYV